MAVSLGTINKRKNGRYTAIPDNGVVNGNRNRIGSKTFDTKAEAKNYLCMVQQNRRHGNYETLNTITVAELRKPVSPSAKSALP